MLHLDDRNVSVSLQSLLDVPQQMLLVHAGSRMDMRVHLYGWKGVRKLSKHQLSSYFSHVVEVPVGNGLLLSQLSDLIEQVVQLIPGLGLTEQTFETRKVNLKEIILKLNGINFIASLETQYLLSFVIYPKYFQIFLLITVLHK